MATEFNTLEIIKLSALAYSTALSTIVFWHQLREGRVRLEVAYASGQLQSNPLLAESMESA